MPNIFIIPSWYPSENNPLNGIFVREQAVAFARQNPDFHMGISIWGQNDNNYLLPLSTPVKNALKLLGNPQKTTSKTLLPNLNEYFSPAYSWHHWIRRGNIEKKINACLKNLHSFESEYGKTDLIHAHVSYPGGYIAMRLSKQLGIPYIITEHMSPFPQKYHLTPSGQLRKEIKSAIDNANRFITVSQALKEDTLKYISNVPEVIPNFIDPAHVLPIKDNNRPIKYITICGMSEEKGIRTLLNAIRKSVDIDPSLTFTMVGDGPDLKSFIKLTEDLALQNNVSWLGYQPREEIFKLLSSHDIHILTSRYESFGVVYIEAMAAGLPSIAAPFGGPKDIITPETGVFVDNLSADAISDKIIWIKENLHQYDAGIIKSNFKDKFSSEAVRIKLKSLYETIIGSYKK